MAPVPPRLLRGVRSRSRWQQCRGGVSRLHRFRVVSRSLMAWRVGSAGGAGVLPSQRLSDLIDEGVIDAGDFKIPRENIQPASLDLRLGEVAYRIRCSFLPDSDT